jgi:hypothetical protein
MSEKEKNFTFFLKVGSQQKFVLNPDSQGLTDWDRVNAMTEQEIEKNALTDLDALPVEDEFIWKKGRWVYPESLSNKVENKNET